MLFVTVLLNKCHLISRSLSKALPKADRRLSVGNGCAPAMNVDHSLGKEKSVDGREVLSQLAPSF
jgi:hypothetical protein